jgi:hypothetical protein
MRFRREPPGRLDLARARGSRVGRSGELSMTALGSVGAVNHMGGVRILQLGGDQRCVRTGAADPFAILRRAC